MADVHEDVAAKRVGRSLRTLRRWRAQGILLGTYVEDHWEYELQAVDNAAKLAELSYRSRRIVPGSGRGRWSPSGMDWLWP